MPKVQNDKCEYSENGICNISPDKTECSGNSAERCECAYHSNEDDRENLFLWNKLMEHYGHHIEIACYGDPSDPANVCLECADCGCVVLDAELYTLMTRTDLE